MVRLAYQHHANGKKERHNSQEVLEQIDHSTGAEKVFRDVSLMYVNALASKRDQTWDGGVNKFAHTHSRDMSKELQEYTSVRSM